MIYIDGDHGGFTEINKKTRGQTEKIQKVFEVDNLIFISRHNQQGIISILDDWIILTICMIYRKR